MRCESSRHASFIGERHAGCIRDVIALTGLGCQNKSSDLSDVSAGYQRRIATPAVTTAAIRATQLHRRIPVTTRGVMATMSRMSTRPIGDANCVSTLCSFVLGHDPDVSTVREIEASVYGD